MTYKETAKELGIRCRLGKYGIKFGRGQAPLDSPYKYGTRKFVTIIPLDDWEFDPKEIIESFANDPDFKISYKDK